jgi:Xaa-Pro dipeptidase
VSKADFSVEEFAERLQRVRAAADAAGLDWLILTHPVSIHWLTGSDAKSYQAFQCLFVDAHGAPTTMLTRESERCEFEQDSVIGGLETWGGNEPADPLTVFERVVDGLGLRSARVGLEVPAYYLHPYHYARVREMLGSALVAEPNRLVADIKAVKSPAELAYIRRSAAIADEALDAFVSALAEGRSELEIAGEVYHALLSRGSGLPASTLNLVSGERCGFSHGAPTERRLRARDTGNIEFGAAYRRYTTTLGRQFSLGPPGERLRMLYETVYRASDAMIATIRNGVPALVPHEAAKAVIAKAGFDRHRVHTSGYGLAPGFPPSWGEPVNIFGGSTDILKAGMVVSVEPPIFIHSERIGARIIDNVLVTEHGAELLSRRPRDLVVVS